MIAEQGRIESFDNVIYIRQAEFCTMLRCYIHSLTPLQLFMTRFLILLFGSVACIILNGCNPEKTTTTAQSATNNTTKKSKNSTVAESTNSTATTSATPQPIPTDLKTVGARVSLTDESINTCRKICSKSESCEKSKQRSFCKWDQESPSCFGLSWETAAHDSVCFTRDSSCKGDYPVKCGIIDSRNPGRIITADFLTVQDRANSCQGLCAFAQGCEKSVCTDAGKTQFPICSYLYWDNGGKDLSPITVSFETDHASAIKTGKVPVECGIFDYKIPIQTEQNRSANENKPTVE